MDGRGELPRISASVRVTMGDETTGESGKALLRVAFLSACDHSNRATLLTRALNQAEQRIFDARSICLRSHVFSYNLKHDWNIERDPVKTAAAVVWLKTSDWIVFSEEKGLRWTGRLKGLTRFNRALGLRLEKLPAARRGQFVMYNRGSCYRGDPKRLNAYAKRCGFIGKRLYAHDLYRFSPDEAEDICIWPAYPLSDQDRCEAVRRVTSERCRGKLRILHAPSNAKKGTDVIDAVVRRLRSNPRFEDRVEWIHPPGRLSNSELLELKKRVDICIDQFGPDIGGFGMATMESLALGNIVMASLHHVTSAALAKANRFLEPDPLPVVDLGASPETLEGALRGILEEPDESLHRRALAGPAWIAQVASNDAVSRKLAAELLGVEEPSVQGEAHEAKKSDLGGPWM